MTSVGFREIADRLREEISSGELASGQALPSESELATRYGVSRTTARRALVLLEDGGLIEGTAGRVRTVRGGGRSAVARYEQVAADLRAEIESKAPGQPVGTEETLGARFNVSPGTARRALQALAATGDVTAIPGRGWFVGSADASRTAFTAAAIRSEIRAGEWPVGTRIPGELALAERYSVGRITVRRALAILEAEGLLEKRSSGGRVVLTLPLQA